MHIIVSWRVRKFPLSDVGGDLTGPNSLGERVDVLENQVARLQYVIARLRRRMDVLEKSNFWKVRRLVRTLRMALGTKPDDPPPALPEDFSEGMHVRDEYARWLLMHECRPSDLERLREVATALATKPSICVVIDDYNADASAATRAISRQIYPCDLLRTSSLCASRDKAQRLNTALKVSKADIIAFCDPDEVLAATATLEVALEVGAKREVQVIYGDHDQVDVRGRRYNPLFLPDWSPETFLSAMYTGRLLFYRRSAVVAAGGFNFGAGTALHYDLALRITETTDNISHRPSILYHELIGVCGWRESADDLKRVVSLALNRRGKPGTVTSSEDCPGVLTIRHALRHHGNVDIIIPTKDQPALLEACLESIFTRSSYKQFAVTIVDNGSIEPRTFDIFRAFERSGERFRVCRLPAPFNFSHLVNRGVALTSAPYVVLLNNDTEVLTSDWIEAMLEYAQFESIGAVGARLLYPDGTLQHAGVVVGLGESAGHVYRGAMPEDAGPGAAIRMVRNYSAVTAACLMVQREAFEIVGGFDEQLKVEFNDVDFCLRLREAGYRNVYLPHVVLRHHESQSRRGSETGAHTKTSTSDNRLFKTRWASAGYRDPYYNINLTRERDDGSIAIC